MSAKHTRAELEQLDKPALVEIILQLAEQVSKLEERGRTPPPNSNNSSLPPSQDQKPNQPTPRGKRKLGPKLGHLGTTRQWVEQPDRVIVQRVSSCSECGSDLSGHSQAVARRHQIVELPAVLAQVIEVHLCAADCPDCGRHTLAVPPAGLEAERAYGARLQATIGYLKAIQHLSYQRLEQLLQDVFGLSLSPGALDATLQRVGVLATAATSQIQAQVAQSAVIHADETGSRIGGAKAWHWVFVSAVAVLHLIRKTRSSAVPREVMGQQQAEVWVCDCWVGQLQAPADRFQLCLAHQVRNLQAVIELGLPESIWAAQVQAIFYNTMRLAKRTRPTSLPDEAIRAEQADLERQLDILLVEEVPAGKARTLRKRYRKHREHLFVCLARSDVAATNNCAERALRPAVLHRKVTNGFRSEWGANAYAALLSVTDTARLHNQTPFHAILDLLGPPALPQAAP